MVGSDVGVETVGNKLGNLAFEGLAVGLSNVGAKKIKIHIFPEI